MTIPTLIGTSGDTLREAFGRTIAKIAHERKDIVLLDADIAGGTGAHHFRAAHGERFLQMGIAEQNMMSAAGGLADAGLVPVVTTFAVFCVRAVEQARLSIAYPNRNVKIFASHPGLDVGPDGASAQSLEDIAIFRSIPNMTVISPADPYEMELATHAVMEHRGPAYVRTGRSPSVRFLTDGHQFEIGKGQILKKGEDIAFICCGKQTYRALQAADMLQDNGVSVSVVNMPTIKPLDGDLLIELARTHKGFVVSEDHNIIGGLFGAVSEFVVSNCPLPVVPAGVNDCFGESGEPDDLADKYGLAAPALADAAARLLKD